MQAIVQWVRAVNPIQTCVIVANIAHAVGRLRRTSRMRAQDVGPMVREPAGVGVLSLAGVCCRRNDTRYVYPLGNCRQYSYTAITAAVATL